MSEPQHQQTQWQCKRRQQNTHLVRNTPASGGRVNNLHHANLPSLSLRPTPLHPDPTHATQRTHPRTTPNQPHSRSNGPSPLLARVQHNISTKQRASYGWANKATRKLWMGRPPHKRYQPQYYKPRRRQHFGVQRARHNPLGNNGGQITHEAIEQRVATTTTSSKRRDTRKS